MSRSRLMGLVALLAWHTGCADAKGPATQQDAALVDVPTPASAEASTATSNRAEPPPKVVVKPVKAPDTIALDEFPATRTLVPQPPTSVSAAPAPQNPAVANASAADKAAARTLFQEGVEAFQNGDFNRARASFEKAYSMVPIHRVLFNIGHAAKQQGDRKGMCKAYRAYLKEASPEEVKRDEPGIKKDCP